MKRLLAYQLLIIIYSSLSATPDPQPGQSIWHVAAQTGTQADSVESKIDLLLAGPGATCNAIAITAPTTITSPGLYCLISDAQIAGPAGIAINSSDVFLNLNGHTISGIGGTHGIVINNPRVTVFNGTIRDMDGNGLFIQSSDECHIHNCDFLSNVTGLQIVSGINNLVEECNAIKNSDAGFDLLTSTGNVVYNCNAIGTGFNIPVFGNVAGFISTDGAANTFDACSSKNTQLAGSGACAGFKFLRVEQQSRITNCTVLNTNATGASIPYGIFLTGPTTFIPRSNAHAVVLSSTGSKLAIGIGDTIYLYTTGAPTLTLVGQAPLGSQINSIAMNFDGTRIAVGTDDIGNDQLLLFDGSLNSIATLNVGGTINSVSFNDAGDRLAVAGDQFTDLSQLQIYLYDGSNLTFVTNLTNGTPLYGTAFNRFQPGVTGLVDGDRVVIGGNAGTFNELTLLDFNGALLTTLTSVLTGTTVLGVDIETTQLSNGVNSSRVDIFLGANAGGVGASVQAFAHYTDFASTIQTFSNTNATFFNAISRTVSISEISPIIFTPGNPVSLNVITIGGNMDQIFSATMTFSFNSNLTPNLAMATLTSSSAHNAPVNSVSVASVSASLVALAGDLDPSNIVGRVYDLSPSVTLTENSNYQIKDQIVVDEVPVSCFIAYNTVANTHNFTTGSVPSSIGIDVTNNSSNAFLANVVYNTLITGTSYGPGIPPSTVYYGGFAGIQPNWLLNIAM